MSDGEILDHFELKYLQHGLLFSKLINVRDMNYNFTTEQLKTVKECSHKLMPSLKITRALKCKPSAGNMTWLLNKKSDNYNTVHVVMYDWINCLTQQLRNQTGGMLKHLNRVLVVHIDRYMHCGLGSQQRSLESHAEKYGSWSRIPESANRTNHADTILAFYCINPFQTHKANSNYNFFFFLETTGD